MEIEPGKTHLTVHEARVIQDLSAAYNRNAIWSITDEATERWFAIAAKQPTETVPDHPIEVAYTDEQLECIRTMGLSVVQHTQRRIDALAAVFTELDVGGSADSDGLISKLREELSPVRDASEEPAPDSMQLLGAMIMAINAYQASPDTVARNTA